MLMEKLDSIPRQWVTAIEDHRGEENGTTDNEEVKTFNHRVWGSRFEAYIYIT